MAFCARFIIAMLCPHTPNLMARELSGLKLKTRWIVNVQAHDAMEGKRVINQTTGSMSKAKYRNAARQQKGTTLRSFVAPRIHECLLPHTPRCKCKPTPNMDTTTCQQLVLMLRHGKQESRFRLKSVDALLVQAGRLIHVAHHTCICAHAC